MKKTTQNPSGKRPPFRSLYWRQLALTLGMVLLTLVLLGLGFFAMSYNYIRSETAGTMQKNAEVVAQIASNYIQDGRIAQDQDFHTLASFASSAVDNEFLICSVDGTALLTTDDSQAGKSFRLPDDILRSVLEEGSYSGTGTLGGVYQVKQFVVALPILSPAGDEVTGIAVALTEASSLTALWRTTLALFWLAGVTVLVIAFLVTSYTTMQQVRPIQAMVQATRRYAGGNFDSRMYDYGRTDEIGELAASFNAMADTLQQTEQQRREFIANISHELKTPMTTIAGYTDGILDGTIPPEKQEHYLRIISDESRRLSRLVRRMLEVSQLQTLDLAHEKKQFDVCESMRRAIISMEHKIRQRGLDVDVQMPDEPTLVLGDTDLITQVIYNLLENAAKFATPASTLYLGISEQNDKALVSVRNHGDTIPAEELPHLFERFHKSDKSRSEDKDGVGLGLYVVKTILEQHGEKIVVTSENGLTTFTFTLQLAK
ncbi:MAG: sensor histidine kinase [Oscillospiraceae bacterium]